MESILETTLTIKQDLFTNYYKITINWGTIQVLENVFYTKVSCIRRLTSMLGVVAALALLPQPRPTPTSLEPPPPTLSTTLPHHSSSPPLTQD